jgi:hypothetical protein
MEELKIMGKTLQEKLSQLPQDRQDRIRQQAEQLIAEELSLRDLRFKRDGCDRAPIFGKLSKPIADHRPSLDNPRTSIDWIPKLAQYLQAIA